MNPVFGDFVNSLSTAADVLPQQSLKPMCDIVCAAEKRQKAGPVPLVEVWWDYGICVSSHGPASASVNLVFRANSAIT